MQHKSRLDDAFELFLLDCQSRRFTKSTLRFYRDLLSLFVRWSEDQNVVLLHDVTPALIKRYLIDIQDRGLSSSYQHGHARAVRAFLNYCVRDELLESSPFDKVRMPRVAQKIPDALSDAEVNKALTGCTTIRDRTILLFLLDSGLRASELVALNIEDVDLSRGTVSVQLGKMQKERVTYVGIRTRKQIKRYLMSREWSNGAQPMFVSHSTELRLTYSGLAQLFRRVKRKSGLKKLTAHMLRRSFAINCLRNAIPSPIR